MATSIYAAQTVAAADAGENNKYPVKVLLPADIGVGAVEITVTNGATAPTFPAKFHVKWKFSNIGFADAADAWAEDGEGNKVLQTREDVIKCICNDTAAEVVVINKRLDEVYTAGRYINVAVDVDESLDQDVTLVMDIAVV